MADEKKHNEESNDKPTTDASAEHDAARPSPDGVDAASADAAREDGNKDDDQDEGGASVGAEPAGPNDGDDDSGEVAADAGPDADAAEVWNRSGEDRLTLSQRNLHVPGTAVIHFETRSVTVQLDGDAGIRLLYRALRGRAADWATDRLHPVRSSARDAWLVLANPDRILAVEWHPGGPGGRSRGVAIDPAV